MSLTGLIPWPYRWLALTALCTALFGYGWLKGAEHGSAKVQARWDKVTVAQQAAAMKATAKNLKIQQALQNQVNEAQNEAHKRSEVLQAAADAARAQSVGLRDQLAVARRGMSSLAEATVRRYADTASVVLSECTERYQTVAADADRLHSAAQTLSQAWPTNPEP